MIKKWKHTFKVWRHRRAVIAANEGWYCDCKEYVAWPWGGGQPIPEFVHEQCTELNGVLGQLVPESNAYRAVLRAQGMLRDLAAQHQRTLDEVGPPTIIRD